MKQVFSILALLLLSACAKVEIDSGPTTDLELGASLPVSVSDSELLSQTHNSAWAEIPAYTVKLTLAPPVHPSVNLRYSPDTPPRSLQLRAASNGETLYLRLHWRDGSENLSTSRTEFADGVAVQFALGAGQTTSFMMGGPAQPVNIWYWKAGSNGAENLAAAGFGSTTPLDEQPVSASSHYANGHWTVVLSRALATPGEHQADLNSSVPIALALWQGETGQRDGLKHVTMGWIDLQPAAIEE